MSPLSLLALGALGGLGAMGRFLLDGTVARRLEHGLPVGTLVVNVTGAFWLGVLVGVAPGDDGQRLLGTGLIGGFTTFSTWVLESHRLGEDGQLRVGVANLLFSLAAGVAAAWVGRALGGSL